jgi:thiamine pyrophosphokinase
MAGFKQRSVSILNTLQFLEIICGDLDSLQDVVREYFLERHTKIVHDGDQYSTDFTKCIKYLREVVFSGNEVQTPDILCFGGLGGRVDQGMSQLHHLLMFQQDGYQEGRVYLLSTEAITFVLKAGKHRVHVKDGLSSMGNQVGSALGKHIGILPIKGPAKITTKGLEWDVSDWLTQFGGQVSTSNHVKDDVVEIFTTDDVLFTIDLNMAKPDPGV